MDRKPKACCLLDEFSYICFRPEFSELVPLRPNNWYDVLRTEKFDFFLCETVWNSYGSGYNIGDIVKKENDKRYKEIRSLVNFARSLDLPTIFWNKEDNVHFRRFLRFAKLFDYILTTDSRTVKDYKRLCPLVKKIDVMIFAAQPLVHNPIRHDFFYEGDIFFAGKWYNFKERKKELQELLDLPRYINLHIYDREYHGKKRSMFPKKFLSRVRKSVSYPEMIKKYKRYPFMINANSVKGSFSMFSRRVPEAIACGVTVISSPSLSLERLFPGVRFVRTKEDVTQTVISLVKDPLKRDIDNHILRRSIWQNHTYYHRVQQICRMIGLQIPRKNDGVAVLRINDKDESYLYHQINNQTYSKILINIPVNMEHYEKVISILTDLFIYRKYKDKDKDKDIDIEFVAFVYPDSYYGENYILDSVLSYMYLPDTRVIGKGSVVIDKTLVNPEKEQIFTNDLHPHTLVYSLKGDLTERSKTLLHARASLGDSVNPVYINSYSSDPFNFISFFNM